MAKNVKPPKHFSLTVKHNGIAREIRSENIHVAGLLPPEGPIPAPQGQGFMGIWDTGATGTVITDKVIQSLGLKPTGMTQVQSANGISRQETYLASIYLPNRIVIPNIEVTRGVLGVSGDILLGMDIISKGDFVLTNRNGKTWFSFRIPSLQRFDFVKVEIQPNRPCTCGSGRLYKNCCAKGPEPNI